MARSGTVPVKIGIAALLLGAVFLLGACAGAAPSSQTVADPVLLSTPPPRSDGPQDLEVDPTAVADIDGTPEPKPEPTPKGEDADTGEDTASGAGGSAEERQTRAQPSASISQTATEHTWQDGDRTLRVTLQLDLVLQEDASPADKEGPTVETGKGVIVRKSDTSDTSGQPVFRSPSGALMTLPGGVLLVLEDAWTEAEVNSFFSRNGIKRDQVSELSYATNGFFVETDPGFPALELANKLATQKGVIISSPNWWTQVTTR